MHTSLADLPLWEFATAGPLRERLNGLALAGAKTGTFSLVVLEDALAIEPVVVGTRWALAGSNGALLAVVETTGRSTGRIADVTWEQVDSEGESFTSVDDWRDGHERYWSQFTDVICAHTNDPDWRITDDTEVIYETFRVVEWLPGAAEARYPVVECSVPADDLELASADLYDLGTVGVEELTSASQRLDTFAPVAYPSDTVHIRAGFPSDEMAVAAEAVLDRRWRPRFEVLLGDDWLDAWREHFVPMRVGRLVIVPGWKDDDELLGDPVLMGMGRGDVVMHLDPGRSFGTGAHASTSLAIEALQTLELDGARVLDIGCGSGIIAVSALLLGASGAHGIDIEQAAVERTRQNADRNGVGDRCSAASTPIGELATGALGGPARHEVVVANILAPVLIAEADAIARTVAPGGTLILSGFVEDQHDRVVAAYPTMALAATLASVDGAWNAVVLRAARPPI